MVKIYHASPWYEYSNWIKDSVPVDKVEEADLVLFCGGTDVYAGRYGQKSHKYAEHPDHPRDEEEIALFKKATSLGIPMLGICRGSQLLCVMNHGTLVQHQENPAYIHNIETYDGLSIPITSTHHQAQHPFNLREGIDYKMLAYTKDMLRFHQGEDGVELNPPVEAEIVYYPNTRALAIQGHPESMNRNRYPQTFEWLDKQVENLLNNTF